MASMVSEVLSTSVVALNAALDEPFQTRSMQRRAYVGADEPRHHPRAGT